MKFQVLFFSTLRDIVGSGELPMELQAGATVHDLLDELFTRWPKLTAWNTSLLIAVDQSYVKRDCALHEGAEVAIMPPVQGG